MRCPHATNIVIPVTGYDHEGQAVHCVWTHSTSLIIVLCEVYLRKWARNCEDFDMLFVPPAPLKVLLGPLFSAIRKRSIPAPVAPEGKTNQVLLDVWILYLPPLQKYLNYGERKWRVIDEVGLQGTHRAHGLDDFARGQSNLHCNTSTTEAFTSSATSQLEREMRTLQVVVAEWSPVQDALRLYGLVTALYDKLGDWVKGSIMS
ncbi:hypothetical protein EV401DRAFT_1929989 [Pisolithus croceorrhizus]|nr:hypothetical protein EV401DRAFT_1929989 [Pisolithus croceorrhizus]